MLGPSSQQQQPMLDFLFHLSTYHFRRWTGFSSSDFLKYNDVYLKGQLTKQIVCGERHENSVKDLSRVELVQRHFTFNYSKLMINNSVTQYVA